MSHWSMGKLVIHPCTIINDRYCGSYSDGSWIAWELDPPDVDPDQWDGDGTCMRFWDDKEYMCGKGETPTEAEENLRTKLIESGKYGKSDPRYVNGRFTLGVDNG